MADAVTEKTIRLASRWFQSIPGRSQALRLHWTKTAVTLFSDHLSKENITLYILQKEEVYTDDLEVIIPALALLDLIKEQAFTNYELDEAKNIEILILDKLKQYHIASTDLDKATKRFQEKLDKHRNRYRINVRGTIAPLIVDHFLRWVILWYFSPNFTTFFWITNIIILPGLVLTYSWFRTRRTHRFHKKLTRDYQGQVDLELVPERNALQMTVLVLLIILSVAVQYAIADVTEAESLSLLTAVGLIVYFSLFLRHFSINKLSERELTEQVNEHARFDELLSADANDEVMIELSSKLKAIGGRLENYVLESALFGALAFSGFLQIMAEELVSFEELENFAYHTGSMFIGFIHRNTELINASLVSLTSKSDLFSLISVETLVCSIFFLVVIASRLRFSDIADRVSYNLDLASVYNDKEEALIAAGNKEASIDFNKKIHNSLQVADEGIREIIPVMAFMRYFRNAGIITFLIILVSSALFISSFLSWLFAILGLASIAYFNRKSLINVRYVLLYNLRLLFIRKGNVFLAGAIIFFAAGFFLRTLLGWANTDEFLLIGSVSLGIFLFVWIVLVPHHDPVFDAMPGANKMEESYWSTVRFFWGLAALLSVLGFFLRNVDLPGGAPLLGIGFSTMMLVFLVIGRILTKPPWLGLISGFALATLTAGIMVKSLHLPGSGVLMSIGFVMTIVILVYHAFAIAKPRRMGIFVSGSFSILLLGLLLKTLLLPFAQPLLYVGLVLSIASMFVRSRVPMEVKAFHKAYVLTAAAVVFFGLTQLGPSAGLERMYDNFSIQGATMERIRNGQEQLAELEETLNEGRMDLDQIEVALDAVIWYRNYSDQLTLPETDDRKMFIRYLSRISATILRNFKDESSLDAGYRLIREANLMAGQEGYFADSFINTSKQADVTEPLWLQSLEPIFLILLQKEEEAEMAKQQIINRKQLTEEVISHEISHYFEMNP